MRSDLPLASQPFARQRIAITGRLGSMARAEAVARIEAAGGTYAATPDAATSLLVVGAGGPPLGEDGHLTRSLGRARSLGIEELSEVAFLERLGGYEGSLDRRYTTDQLSRILGVPASQIRSWVRHGLIQPARTVGRLGFFDFHEVASARLLHELTAAGVTPQRIRKSLAQVGAWGPLSLSQLEMLESGGPLLVRTPAGDLAEPSGQLRLDFDPSADATEQVREATPALRITPSGASRSEDWFECGVEAEEEDRLEDAVAAYERAIALCGPAPEVLFNLGNVLYALDRRSEAATRFREATAIEGDYVEAWNNLGIVLGELDETDEAVRAFETAIGIEPGYADPHYNVAEAYAAVGCLDLARDHWRAYLALDPDSAWAVEVRKRLARSEDGTPPLRLDG